MQGLGDHIAPKQGLCESCHVAQAGSISARGALVECTWVPICILRPSVRPSVRTCVRPSAFMHACMYVCMGVCVYQPKT